MAEKEGFQRNWNLSLKSNKEESANIENSEGEKNQENTIIQGKE